MNYAEYDNYGTITEFTKDKTIIYRPENEKQSTLYNDARMLNKSLYVEFEIGRLFLFLLIVLIFFAFVMSYLFFNYYLYIQNFLWFWLFCCFWFFYNINEKYKKVKEFKKRINKEIPHETKYN